MTSMFTEAFPILVTRDLARLLAFYRDLLGYIETYRFPPGAADHATQYVGLRLGSSSQLGIARDDAAATGAGQRFDLCVYSEDCDAAVTHLRAHGTTVTGEPTDMPWGERAAHVEDPDANRLVLLSPLAGSR